MKQNIWRVIRGIDEVLTNRTAQKHLLRMTKEYLTGKTKCTMTPTGQGLIMECRVCGHRHEGWYIHQSWECPNGCRIELNRKGK